MKHMAKNETLSVGRIGILGIGKMGEAIVKGLQSRHGGAQAIQATTRSSESAVEAKRKLGISCHTDSAKLVAESDVLLLCVKPHQGEALLSSLASGTPGFRKGQLLISICASLTTEQLSRWTGGKIAVIRAMPNTPCLVGEGMTVFSPGKAISAEQLKLAQAIFGTIGQTAVVEESLMDGVTGLSGCGPAYIYLIIEALSEAGVKVGLPRKVATQLAAQTLLGSAKMVLERGEHPAALKDEVTTPAGCTIDGLMALEEGKLRVTLIKAVLAATKRSKSLRGE